MKYYAVCTLSLNVKMTDHWKVEFSCQLKEGSTALDRSAMEAAPTRPCNNTLTADH